MEHRPRRDEHGHEVWDDPTRDVPREPGPNRAQRRAQAKLLRSMGVEMVTGPDGKSVLKRSKG